MLTEAVLERDSLHRFVFERAGVRGALVRLNASWEAVRDNHVYPGAVREQLGDALAAVLLLSATIKLEGSSLILQVQGQGPLHTLVAQASAHRTVRALARWRGEVPAGGLEQIFGSGHLALTVHGHGGEPYQGIVPLEGESVADALETYFTQSEQLATRLWLATGAESAAGLLVQNLPGQTSDPDDWPRIALLAATVTAGELHDVPAMRLLSRLFHEEDIRLFEAEPVAFRCTCSRARIEQTLAALGHERLGEFADASGALVVTCEFCNRDYRYDRVDVERALVPSPQPEPPATLQ